MTVESVKTLQWDMSTAVEEVLLVIVILSNTVLTVTIIIDLSKDFNHK